MQAAIKLTARVLPGHRIEIVAPELPEGKDVEVFVALPAALPDETILRAASTQEKTRPYVSILDFIDSLPPSTMTAEDWERREREIQEEKNSWGD